MAIGEYGRFDDDLIADDAFDWKTSTFNFRSYSSNDDSVSFLRLH